MKQGTEYELFVQEIYRDLNSVDGLENVEIKHDVIIPGTARDHQIDVYWAFTVGGVPYRVAVECKDYKRPVTAEKIEAFHTVLQDIGGIKGIYATRTGFQSGAIKVAKVHGIELMEIRQPIDADWKGKIRYFNFTLKAKFTTNIRPCLLVDQEWLNQQTDYNLENFGAFPEETVICIYDQDGMLSSKCTIGDIIRRIPNDKVGLAFEYKEDFEDAYFEYGDMKCKIKGIIIQYDVVTSSEELHIDGAFSIKSIVKNIISGEKKLVDIHGNVRDIS